MHQREKPKIAVLLSTFNPGAYFNEQLESIFSQGEVEIFLFIRDDGSAQGLELLEPLKQRANVFIQYGQNLGPAKSFLKLVSETPLEFDYFAFSDQDDWWESDKLKRATKILENENGEAIYCSALTVCNERLETLYQQNIDDEYLSLKHALFHNFATGNTIVLNMKAMLFLKRIPLPKHPYMHDWWILLVLLAAGKKCRYDHSSRIKYRQHANNHLGLAANLNGLYRRVSNISRPKEIKKILQQVSDLTESHIQWNDHEMETYVKSIAASGSICTRINFTIKNPIKTRSILRSMLFNFQYIFTLRN